MGSSILIYDLQDDPQTINPQLNWNLITALFSWMRVDRSNRDMSFTRFRDLLNLVFKYLMCGITTGI